MSGNIALQRVAAAVEAAKAKHPLFPETPYGMSSILAEEAMEAITAANDWAIGKIQAYHFFEEVEHVAAVCQRILEQRYEIISKGNYDG